MIYRLVDHCAAGVASSGAGSVGATAVDVAAVPARALLLTGAPGVGKSALLEAAAALATAAGVRVLRATGVEFGAGIDYCGLNQLLAPLLPNAVEQNLVNQPPAGPNLAGAELDRLCRAIRGAGSGADTAASADRFAVGNAALDLLRTTADERPLLLLADDAQWLDTPSATVLGFVSRRLARTRVAFIAATRSGSDGPLNRAGLPHRLLRPLDDAAAALLVGSSFPALAGRVQQRVLAEANGNPLALVELPGTLTESQQADAEPLPVVLPLTQRLRALFAARLGPLPASCRELLLLAALDGTGSIDVLTTAAGVGAVEQLAPAEYERLIDLERDGRLVFRHPLVRAAVVEQATGIEQLRAHRVLADAYPGRSNRRAWHLAEASLRPDEDIAAMLDASAHLTLRQGDAVHAVTVLTRAAELSPDRSHRGRRLAVAAYIDADVAGGLAHVSRLLDDAATSDFGAVRSLPAAIADAYLRLNGDGDVQSAHRLLVAAIDRHRRRPGFDPDLSEALHTLLFECFFAGRDDWWEQFHTRLANAGPQLPAVLSIGAHTFADPARAAHEVLARLDAMIADLRDESDPTVIVRCGMAAIYVDRLAGCRSAFWRVVRDGRAGGAVTSAIDALTLLCFDDLASGEWEHAGRLSDEALALCADNGYRLLEWPGLLARALLAAARGQHDVVTEVTARMQGWAVPRGVRIVRDYARQADALAAVGRGDFEQAYRQASAISPAGSLASHIPQALWVAFDLVESAVQTGRRESAARHIAAMDAAGIAAISPRLALTTAGCRAVAADADADARALYERALAVPGAERWPFELARLQLCYGEFLRRQRDVAAARDQFTAALQCFQRLHATPWVARASRGVRATGVPVRRPDAAGAVQLSAQQMQIARLAGSGLSNKEIAARLYLSHRTVGAHLYRLYPQLGVTSRAGLRDALASMPSSVGADAGQVVR